jgi:hypothetical protein
MSKEEKTEIALPTADNERDWTEDFAHENGKYYGRCVLCECEFLGHKRRVTCKKCASANSPR